MSEANEQAKQPYSPPVLTIYGSVEDLTREGGTRSNDGLAGSRSTI